jgi:hypothetical protein
MRPGAHDWADSQYWNSDEGSDSGRRRSAGAGGGMWHADFYFTTDPLSFLPKLAKIAFFSLPASLPATPPVHFPHTILIVFSIKYKNNSHHSRLSGA